MNKLEFQHWPDGTHVRFTEDARKAMTPGQGDYIKPLRTPVGGMHAVYTIDNTDDTVHDVILRENGERWGTYWLEAVDALTPQEKSKDDHTTLEEIRDNHLRSIYLMALRDSGGETINERHLDGLRAIYNLGLSWGREGSNEHLS